MASEFFFFFALTNVFSSPAFSRLERSLALVLHLTNSAERYKKVSSCSGHGPRMRKGPGEGWRGDGDSDSKRGGNRGGMAEARERAFCLLCVSSASFSLAHFHPHCGAHVLKKPATTTGSAVVAKENWKRRTDEVQRERKTFPFSSQ